MMNKYITALLVVLAATGVESQTYQYAIKAALSNATIEEICHRLDLKEAETEVLSVIEAYKQIHKEDKQEPCFYSQLYLSSQTCPTCPTSPTSQIIITAQDYLPNPSLCSAIVIRAPSA